ncbi:MAG: 2-hydroxyacyl-CoA dehydratase subunit D [Thermodesulfobacteriota bacterium]
MGVSMDIEEIREKSRPQDDSQYMGWVCSYTPEELLMAAGFTPYRLLTATDLPSGSEAYLAPNLCPYVHRLFSAARQGRYYFLTGSVFVLSCDAMRRLSDIWSLYLDSGFVYNLDVPRRWDKHAEEFFRKGLQDLRDCLQSLTGRRIRDEDVSYAVDTVNCTRILMQRLFDLRFQDPELLSGEEVLSLCRISTTSDKKKFNICLQQFLQELSGWDNAPERNKAGYKRIMLYGNIVEDGSIYFLVEQAGGEVVLDDHCLSSRHFDLLVEEQLPPLQGIAQRYLQKCSCPRMQGMQERVDRIVENILHCRCDGLIIHSLKFCDLLQSELPRLERVLKSKGIEFLHIERENLAEDPGQLKTRIEAFMEVLGRKRDGNCN